jgi:diguanylate cyclase (GGDEF)-like protein
MPRHGAALWNVIQLRYWIFKMPFLLSHRGTGRVNRLLSGCKIEIQSLVLAPLQVVDVMNLLVARSHSPTVMRERVNHVALRVRRISAVLSLLTVLWIGVDMATVPWPQWGGLMAGRLVASLAFGVYAYGRLSWPNIIPLREVGFLLTVPLALYFYSNVVVGGGATGNSLGIVTAYYYLPFVLAAGLSLFPLTVLESTVLGSVVIAAMAIAIQIWPHPLAGHSAAMMLWLLTLVAGISGVAGVNQLDFLIRLTEQATRDGLTGLLVRRVGEEILEAQFAHAKRRNLPFSILFIDLDHFKSVNDKFGHDAGDNVLRDVANHLRQAFRSQDSLIRWGGEEFVVALPGTDMVSAEAAVRRMAVLGIGRNPNGGPITASIGISERLADGLTRPGDIVQRADLRMYEAKRAGRNRYVSRDQSLPWLQKGCT